MTKDVQSRLLSCSAAGLIAIQGLGLALVASYSSLSSLFFGLNVLLCGVWLAFHEVQPALAPFELPRGLETPLGKAYTYQFIAFASVDSFFGSVWDTFVLVWLLFVSAVFVYIHFAHDHHSSEAKQESLLMHDYQKLDIQAM
ncbi:hypothetical protein SDRG_01799 [Saprolegnia diclina VS20]|uniref:Uncharacterized protein n=1 Tax=Saprolegnia diclina (strain VS20) TaxID=1156394 RepID=T0SCW9_SAPDV|nr:hypothetical protein SDRG_01799 [Saprolegnia diclina VS20]EQC40727.1 hypothetical protein SDRG_01799 [Saprolegnia diclina VS20]|eukprot:XP_008605571.1 hypothetical protein SDRG_01799 [Saprolegnia diclina VS20]